MTTVGYGEISPISYLGKFTAVILSYSGVFLTAALVIGIHKFFKMKVTEEFSFYILTCLSIRQNIETYAGKVFQLTYLYNKAKKEGVEDIKELYLKLKRAKGSLHYCIRELWNIQRDDSTIKRDYSLSIIRDCCKETKEMKVMIKLLNRNLDYKRTITRKLSKIPIVPDVPNISDDQESSRISSFAINSDDIFLSFQ